MRTESPEINRKDSDIKGRGANENSKYVNGKVEKNDEPLTLINAQSKGHFS